MANYLATSNGNELGWYEAQSEMEALDLAAQDMGYADHEEYEEEQESEGTDESINVINMDQSN